MTTATTSAAPVIEKGSSLWADAWRRLGDRDEAARCLAEAEEHLRAAAGLPDADLRAIAAQREAIARDRAR